MELRISLMQIETGDPEFTGRYACYLPGIELPTMIRFWLVGSGWLNYLGEPLAGPVAGWIGPLPVWPENSVKYVAPPEFDL
jgi:hypothetical protein